LQGHAELSVRLHSAEQARCREFGFVFPLHTNANSIPTWPSFVANWTPLHLQQPERPANKWGSRRPSIWGWGIRRPLRR